MGKCGDQYKPPTDWGKVGYVKGARGNAQTRVPAPEPQWLDWESYYAREDAEKKAERFTPPDSALPADLYSVVNGRVRRADGSRLPSYPWIGERPERIKIARQAVEEGLRGVEVDMAVDLTLFARRFERWAEEGFPI